MTVCSKNSMFKDLNPFDRFFMVCLTLLGLVAMPFLVIWLWISSRRK